MFGSRWDSILVDNLATTTGVRVICVDRPGMGGSTPVPSFIRIAVWLETVPALLKALNVKHVSLASHSAGTIYALNTIYHLRDILDPQRPYLAMVAPYVHHSHSQAMLMKVVSKIPVSVMGAWAPLAKFVSTRITPTASWSGGIVSSTATLFQGQPGTSETGKLTFGEKYGVSEEIGKCIDKLHDKWMFAESNSAGNDEALLCIKKPGTEWGVCDDYEEYVLLLVEREKQRLSARDDSAKLKIDVFFAESDLMIGTGGQRYFVQCWKQDGVVDTIDFRSRVLPGTDHDTAVMDLGIGAMKTVFEHIRGPAQ
ncbi:hypothetical protein LTR08_005597 [Meristemomyces frigidus]|nr:hypothetical protein LTR08_005597 [Meristemomyces frigidus]